MEKLIELLNEYEIEKKKEIGEITYVWTNAEGLLFAKRHGINALSILETRAVLVNKEYGFIQRLVEKDKIDTTNKFTIMTNVENKENGLGYSHTFEGYEALIMLLSIQDNPIEFLISILK